MNLYEINQYEWGDGFFHLSDSKVMTSKKELEEKSYHKNDKLYEIVKLDIDEVQGNKSGRKLRTRERL